MTSESERRRILVRPVGHDAILERLERLSGDTRAAADAATFASFEIADASGQPVDAASAPRDGIVVLEAPAGADGAALASQLDASVLQRIFALVAVSVGTQMFVTATRMLRARPVVLAPSTEAA